MINTLTYDPQVLQGRTWSQIAASVQVPSSAVAKGADGSANLMTAAICKITDNQPGSVCGALPTTVDQCWAGNTVDDQFVRLANSKSAVPKDMTWVNQALAHSPWTNRRLRGPCSRCCGCFGRWSESIPA